MEAHLTRVKWGKTQYPVLHNDEKFMHMIKVLMHLAANRRTSNLLLLSEDTQHLIATRFCVCVRQGSQYINLNLRLLKSVWDAQRNRSSQCRGVWSSFRLPTCLQETGNDQQTPAAKAGGLGHSAWLRYVYGVLLLWENKLTSEPFQSRRCLTPMTDSASVTI